MEKEVFPTIIKRLGGFRMTAEIVLMNPRGVALAADSAVAIGRERKVYHSAKKLFELAPHVPVGVMIYGVESLFNVPWETLIKMYGNELNNQRFPTLKEYVQGFIRFLNDNEYEAFMSDVNEVNFINRTVNEEIERLYEKLLTISRELYAEYGELHLQEEIQLLYVEHGGNFLKESLRTLEESKFIPVFDEEDFTFLLENYGGEIERLIEEKFESHLFVGDWMEWITHIVILRLLKKFTDAKSGIVFTGFGEKEIYPSVISFYVEGKINGKLKYCLLRDRTKKIDHSLNSTILPFAQTEMVHSFIRGIHRDIEGYTEYVLSKELENLTNNLVEKLAPSLRSEADLGSVRNQVEEAAIDVYHTFIKHSNHYQERYFIDPIMDVVGSLPVVELAHMAEALLNIASYKMKMSPNLETVGGPIDVAIITKGDGFTWIKQKHGDRSGVPNG